MIATIGGSGELTVEQITLDDRDNSPGSWCECAARTGWYEDLLGTLATHQPRGASSVVIAPEIVKQLGASGD